LGKVIKMTPKGVRVKFEVTHRRQGNGEYFLVGENVIKKESK
jgi:hypothetical protein